MIGGPVDAGEREDRGRDLAARVPGLRERAVDGERDRVHGVGEADALPVRAARAAAAEHRGRRRP